MANSVPGMSPWASPGSRSPLPSCDATSQPLQVTACDSSSAICLLTAGGSRSPAWAHRLRGSCTLTWPGPWERAGLSGFCAFWELLVIVTQV